MGEAAIAMAPLDVRRREGPAPVIEHRRFGSLRASFRPERNAFTWECLDLTPTARGLADLELEAGAWGPGAAHEQQLDEVVANLDALTAAAVRLMATRLGEVSGLEWQGALITGRQGDFQLHYWCTIDSEILVTVWFEQSQPRRVEIHD